MFNPVFKEESFKLRKRQSLEGLKQAKTQPAAIATDLIAKINYGEDHILAMNQGGTEVTLNNITLADIENYYKNYISAKDAKVVIVGDIKENEILPQLAFLKKLPTRKIAMPVVDGTPKPVDQSKIYLVDIPKAAQTEFRVGYATGLKYDATGEYYKAGLLNYALGGSFNSRINLNLREDKGWTYGARTGFDGDDYGGSFGFSSGIRADATDSALKEVVSEMRNYAENGINEEELLFMKNAIGQRDALRYETGPQKAAFISRILDYNLPANYVEKQNKILRDITKKEIDAMAKKWINPNKLNILLVGDKAKILVGLQKSGYPIVELDTDGKTTQKKAF